MGRDKFKVKKVNFKSLEVLNAQFSIFFWTLQFPFVYLQLISMPTMDVSGCIDESMAIGT